MCPPRKREESFRAPPCGLDFARGQYDAGPLSLQQRAAGGPSAKIDFDRERQFPFPDPRRIAIIFRAY